MTSDSAFRDAWLEQEAIRPKRQVRNMNPEPSPICFITSIVDNRHFFMSTATIHCYRGLRDADEYMWEVLMMPIPNRHHAANAIYHILKELA